MYGKPAPPFWEFPTCMITSYLLTVILEVTVNWILNCSVMSLEVTWGKVAPLDSRSLSWWPKKDSTLYWYFICSDLVIAPAITPAPTYLQRISWHLRRCLPWMLYILLFLTPIFSGLTYLAYGNDNYNSFPQPQILVASFGVLVAVLTVPFWTIITLASIGDKIAAEREF
jgi:hypothetical protein